VCVCYTHVVDGYTNGFAGEKGKEKQKVSFGYNTKWNILNEWHSYWNLRYAIQFVRNE